MPGDETHTNQPRPARPLMRGPRCLTLQVDEQIQGGEIVSTGDAKFRSRAEVSRGLVKKRDKTISANDNAFALAA